MKKYIYTLIFLLSSQICFSQNYPSFGSEIPVTINGLTFDAMEPSISADGNYMFFNSLNNGTTTSLYYALKVNDSTFNYVGELYGANQTVTPRLDAVASSDSMNNFFWTSMRDFPTEFDNCFYGTFNGTDVVNIGRLHGTFYIYVFGWIMMDAAINYSGNLLYYTNAYFGPTYSECSGAPCESKLGVAQKQNDSVFNKLNNSDGIMQNVNDTNYAVYAPFISKNELELYFTRFDPDNLANGTEICVSVRNNPTDTFSLPFVIHAFSNQLPEAITLTTDMLKMYHHKKVGGIYKLFLHYRTSTMGINENRKEQFHIYPNPVENILYLKGDNLIGKNYSIYNLAGKIILSGTFSGGSIDVSELEKGVYLVKVGGNLIKIVKV